MNSKKIYLSIWALLFVFNGLLYAQSVIEWNFYSSDVTGKEATSNACFNDIDLKQSVLTRGAGAPGNSGFTNGFVGTIQPSTSKEDAVSGNVYFEFKVQPKEGNTVSLSELTAQLRTQTACSYQWMYSKNNAEFADLSTVVNMDNTSTGVDQTPINLSSIADLQSLASTDSVTFRIYVWGGTIVQGFGFGKSGGSSTSGYKASIIVKGAVTRAIPVIAGWNLESYTGITNGSLNASTLNSNLQSAVLGRGAGFTAGSLNFSYVSTTSLLGTTKEEAITNNEYFEIVLNTKDGYKTSLDALNFKYRRNSAGPSHYKWRYSLNGADFTDVGNAVQDTAYSSGDGIAYSVNLDEVTALQNVASGTTITLRMYIWGSGGNTQVFGFGRYYVGSVAIPGLNTISFKGNVQAIESGNVNVHEGLLSVYASAEKLTIKNKTGFDQKVKFTITDIAGKQLFSSNINVLNGNNSVSIPVKLNKGNYIVTLIDSNGSRFNSKIVF